MTHSNPSIKKPRRRFSPDEKARIVKRHLIGREPISDLCDEFALQPSQIYRWQEQLFQNASAAFERTPGRGASRKDSVDSRRVKQIEDLEARLLRRNEVVAELMEEHVSLKKTLGRL